jgi:hypothetical protein
LDGINAPPTAQKVLARLAERNYLEVQGIDSVDLVFKTTNEKVELEHRGKVLIETSLTNFMENPGHVLKSFASKSDGFRFFRQATFLSLLAGFPIVLYVAVSTLFYGLASFLLRPGRAAVLAGLLCLSAGCLMVFPVRSGMQTRVTPERVPELLQSEKWQDNVNALKALTNTKSRFPSEADASHLAASPLIPVRYWLARSLAPNKGSKTYAVLMQLMDDPQPIVACQALYSLGKRKEPQSIRIVLDKINQSSHWYVQWYGYNALRVLGWRQKSSI